MSKSIPEYVNSLRKRSVTVYVLRSLDFLVPGEWENIVDFEEMVIKVTGEKDPAIIKAVANRSDALFRDRSERYRRAWNLYSTVDNTDRFLATAALANKVGERVRFLSLLQRITPKADKAQTIDFSMKLTVELLNFCLINGIPGDSIGDFVAALGTYSKDELMRMSALVCLDGILPLGPDFSRVVLNTLDKLSTDELEDNRTFRTIRKDVPGSDTPSKLRFILEGVDSVKGWLQDFVAKNDLNSEKVFSSIQNFIDINDNRLDYWSAFLDMTTNYYTHTGTQTLGRRIIERAINEI
ncbi:MAG: hypothetical protein KDE19_24790 [Caldilineaceae bacterium]|nr:hypothetical protein [Caldilineaceae bacterium]